MEIMRTEKTHKVIDIVSFDENALFYGNMNECYEWKVQQGFGYVVVLLDEEEIKFANSECD